MIKIIFVLLMLAFATPSLSLDYDRCAVVTLLFNSDYGFMQYAEALAYSLTASNTRMKMIAMVTQDIDNDDRLALYNAKWNVIAVPPITSLDFVHTKLHIFNMTEYDKVIFLDADTQVMENIDALCFCDAPFSAVVRDSLIDTSVMVVEPRHSVYNDIINSVGGTFSYDTYFKNMEHCRMYQPGIKAPCFRLPIQYNGDVFFFMTHGYWPGDTSPFIVHHSIGPLKPYNWMSYAVVSYFYTWWDLYSTKRTTEYVDTIVFLSIPVCLIAFWVAVVRLDFEIPFFSLAFVNVCMTSRLFKSCVLKLMIGHGLHILAILCAFTVSFLVFIDPLVNATIAVVSYFSFYEVLCLQITNYLLASMIINEHYDLVAKDDVGINIPLPDNAKFYRLIVFSSTAGAAFILMTSTTALLYEKCCLVLLWCVFVPGIIHTTFIVNNYVRDLPLKINVV